jgi:chromosome condensin MukBEF ATPase and DNA-binding subunit MukB
MMELQNHAGDYAAELEAQIEDLKQIIASLRIQLADMRQQRDKWQSRAERISLTAPC